jgi:DNA mismatch endonuclease (patch repair protein)
MFDANVIRDRRNARQLRRLGWRVFTVWECQVNSPEKAFATASRLKAKLERM